jgi:superfamily II DNA or RNA helicase
MSICLESKDISIELEDKILKEVFVKKIEGGNSFAFNKFSKQKAKEKLIQPIRLNNSKDKVYIPFDWSLKNINNAKRPNRSEFSSINVKFNTSLREGQKQVKDECVSALNKKGSILLSLFPGFGKTCLAIFLASKIGLKTLIICHRIILIEQWIKAIERFIDNPKIGFVKPSLSSKKMDQAKSADFLIVNAQNVKTLSEDFFKDVGLVIIDEIHCILAESLSECLGYISPRYLIGLSATPHRSDGLDKLLDFYFGEGNKIVRELYHPHIVYKIDTGIEYEDDSKEWNAMISSQCLHEKRNNLIVNIALHFKDRHFLILCKRVEQAKHIFSKLEEEKENVSIIVEENNDFDPKSRIIVASSQKCGVGFSHDILDSLILGSDIEEYFIQYLARVMRTEEVKPMVFDLIDNNKSLKRHFTERKKVYEKAGGVIHNFNKEFPELMKELKEK